MHNLQTASTWRAVSFFASFFPGWEERRMNAPDKEMGEAERRMQKTPPRGGV
jgi:hypothetical protein